jgi:hypothetical protein
LRNLAAEESIKAVRYINAVPVPRVLPSEKTKAASPKLRGHR